MLSHYLDPPPSPRPPAIEYTVGEQMTENTESKKIKREGGALLLSLMTERGEGSEEDDSKKNSWLLHVYPLLGVSSEHTSVECQHQKYMWYGLAKSSQLRWRCILGSCLYFLTR
jgi:hypothetical protein